MKGYLSEIIFERTKFEEEFHVSRFQEFLPNTYTSQKAQFNKLSYLSLLYEHLTLGTSVTLK